jgi:hypothetical protein
MQRVLNLISDIPISDIDIKARRVSGANAGAERAGVRIRPGRDHVFIRRDGYAHVLPAVDCWALAARHNGDRLITELEIGYTARRDGDAQSLMRKRR